MKTLIQRLGMAVIGCDVDYDFDADFDGIDGYDNYDDYEDAEADCVETGCYDNGSQVAFCGGENSDGMIHKGNITVERTISGETKTFPHYKKGSADYIKVGSQFIRIDNGNFTIGNVQYNGVRI